MAVAEGFEPSDGGYPSHAFEACSLGRSDTPPGEILRFFPNYPKSRGLTFVAVFGEKAGQRCGAIISQHTAPNLRAVS